MYVYETLWPRNRCKTFSFPSLFFLSTLTILISPRLILFIPLSPEYSSASLYSAVSHLLPFLFHPFFSFTSTHGTRRITRLQLFKAADRQQVVFQFRLRQRWVACFHLFFFSLSPCILFYFSSLPLYIFTFFLIRSSCLVSFFSSLSSLYYYLYHCTWACCLSSYLL